MRRRNILFILLLLWGCSDSSGDKNKEVYTPVTASLYEPASPVLGTDNKYHLIYGLMLTNTSSVEATLDKVEVMDSEDNSLLTLEDDKLLFFLHHLNSRRADDNKIDQDGSRMLFVSLDFDSKDAIPKKITHKISVQGAKGPGVEKASSLTYTAGMLDVPKQKPVVIGAPLKGEGWVVFNGCCSFLGVHQATMMPVDGTLYNAQRFAMDLMKFGPKGKLLEGDPKKLDDWIGYDAEVFAVADGTVVSVLDGLENHIPGELPKGITIENVTGNHVVIKIDEGVFAFYGHLQKEGIEVKVGDKVKKGDLIAHLGNTGNTSAPHMHLHLMESPSPIGSKPLPFVIDTFVFEGSIAKEYFQQTEVENLTIDREKFKPEKRDHQLPLDLSVIEFK